MPETLGTLLDGLRTGAWLGRRRIIAYGAILLVLELAGFAFLVAGTHGLIVPLDKPTTTDFVSFYAAGKLAAAGTPALAYDQAAHYAAEKWRRASLGSSTSSSSIRRSSSCSARSSRGCPISSPSSCSRRRRSFPVSWWRAACCRSAAQRSSAASRLSRGVLDARPRAERVSDGGAVRRRDAAHRPPAGIRRAAARRALLQAAFRPAHPGRAGGGRPLARLRRGGGRRCRPRHAVGRAVRLGDLA